MYPALQSRDDLLKMLDEMTASRRSILADCASLTDAQLNDPVYAGTWSVLENLAHLAWAEAYLLGWVQHRPNALPRAAFPPDVPRELPAVRTALDEAHAASIAFLKANPESVLREPCVFGKDARPETVGGIFFHIVEHEIGHRAFVLHKLSKVKGKP